ncbi:DUF6879 family protein [Streptomyces sp. NPDC057257]|uniref:DUF6879 family protein n=1 Tax=Streptomyces sp. NPDC057257 TaxID=3346071 RepID=UPI00363355BC
MLREPFEARPGVSPPMSKPSARPKLQPFTSISYLFQEFEHTTWRLETRRGYASDRNSPKWACFLAGADMAREPDNAWHENVRVQTARGKRIERVRLIDEPLTQNQEFLLASTATNLAAGEDIRLLIRTRARQLRLLMYDFWLFDARVLVRFAFDDEDRTLGAHVTEDPVEVLAACQTRDAAWHHAVRTTEWPVVRRERQEPPTEAVPTHRQ